MMGFEIKPSKIDGNGVFATCLWLKRRKIGEVSGVWVSNAEVERISANEDRIHLWEFEDGKTLKITSDLKYLNHSCKPNAYCRLWTMHTPRWSVEVSLWL